MLLCLAGRECARAFVARTDVETIQLAEVGVADDLQAPEQSQTQRAPDTAGDFQNECATAQRRHVNIDLDFFFA